MVRRLLISMVLRVSSLGYYYHRNTPYQVQALDGVSFSARAGEILGIIGPTGSGKSCLLRCLAGVLSPASGRIEVNVPRGDTGLQVGLVIQEAECQFFLDSVGEEVGYPLGLHGASRERTMMKVREIMDQVGYDGDLQSSPFHLSGGQQRRIALAAILILNPAILLLDEPTVGLDASGLAMIRKVIAAYRRSQRTVILVSHDVDFLYRHVDRFLAFQQGKLLADFPKSQYPGHVRLLAENGIAIPEIVQLGQRKLPEEIRRYLAARETEEAGADD
jgi:energy-coupling factor transporter ATP-binding protein EcfA2